MSELVINSPVRMCCGLNVNQCQCHDTDEPLPLPEPVINARAVPDIYNGQLSDDDDLLPLPALNEASFCSPALNKRKPADLEEDEEDEGEMDDEDDIVAQNHRRLFGNDA